MRQEHVKRSVHSTYVTPRGGMIDVEYGAWRAVDISAAIGVRSSDRRKRGAPVAGPFVPFWFP
jgi:hypothetical protein